jgi:arylsulfatase A-like enzyme
MNVIVVMSDSFRRDHVGAFGNPWIKTPNLDRFASQSTVFPQYRIGSYATIPIRTDLFTGRFCHAERPWQPLKPDDVVLAEILQRKGVSTYLAGDTPHIFRMGLTFMRGFDAYHWSRGSEGDLWWTDHYNEQAYTSPTGKGRVRFSGSRGEGVYKGIWSQGQGRTAELDWTTPQTFQAAIEWLTRNSRRKNFFLYVDTFDPHEPWDPPRWATDLYDSNYKGVPYAWAEYGASSQYGGRELRQLRALYAGECTVVDRWFGRLLDTVDLLGLSEDTLVVFMSDHGHYLGYPNDGRQLGKATGYRKSDGQMAGSDADVFTPLLDSVSNPIFMARMPRQTQGGVRQEMIQPPDLMPTILDFLKKPISPTVQGDSMLPLLQGKKKGWRTSAVTAGHRSFAQISDRRWLYGTWVHEHPPKLFDRKTDPDQKRDVLKKNPAVARRLHRKLVAELKHLGSPTDFVQTINDKIG